MRLAKNSVGSRPSIYRSRVKGVQLLQLPVRRDPRGDLCAGEFRKQIPFLPKRYFMVLGVPHSEIRGEHAHKKCHQFLICISGHCTVVVDNGRHREEFQLDQTNKGLYIPPMVWAAQFNHSPGAVLLVFASDHYDPKDYIREYKKFLHAKKIPV